jgi:hypothetical protein
LSKFEKFIDVCVRASLSLELNVYPYDINKFELSVSELGFYVYVVKYTLEEAAVELAKKVAPQYPIFQEVLDAD